MRGRRDGSGLVAAPEGLRDLAGVRGDAPSNISHEYPTGVKGAGGSGGRGRASRRGAERSEDA